MPASIKQERLTDLAGGPRNAVLVGVNAVHDEFTAAAHIVDGVFKDFDVTGGFNDNIEAVRVVGFELVELSAGVLARQSDILVAGAEGFCELHLETLRSTDYDVASTVQAE